MKDNTIIIGNGTGALVVPNGDKIDSFNNVVRCNRGFRNNAGWELYTGHKTNTLAVNPGLLKYAAERRLNARIPGYDRISDILSVHMEDVANPVIPPDAYPDKTITTTAPEIVAEALAGTGQVRASTGLLTILHFLQKEGSVTIYGFQPLSDRYYYGGRCLGFPVFGSKMIIPTIDFCAREYAYLRRLPGIHFWEDET